MSIMSLNISVSIMIILTLLVRRIFRSYIPHSVFCFLWVVIFVRLSVPVELDSYFSFWNVFIKLEDTIAVKSGMYNLPTYNSVMDIIQNNSSPATSLHKVIWALVCVTVGVYFLFQYIGIKKETSTSSFINDEFVTRLTKEQHLFRRVHIKSMKGIDSPSVLGIIHPTIFFPEHFDFGDHEVTRCILLHEIGHIKHFHTLYKIFSTVIVCLYWYNPFVWIMYFTLDRDMEITADRFVIKQLGRDKRDFYAHILISAATNNKRQPIFYFHFKNKLINERIEAIMKFKKLSVGAIVVTLLIPSCMFTAFATTDSIWTKTKMEQIDFTVESIDYTESIETMDNISIEIPWEELEPYIVDNGQKALDRYEVLDYEYVTYGKLPPKSITVTATKNGHEYKGTLDRARYTYDDATDKYTGYYRGYVYLQD